MFRALALGAWRPVKGNDVNDARMGALIMAATGPQDVAVYERDGEHWVVIDSPMGLVAASFLP